MITAILAVAALAMVPSTTPLVPDTDPALAVSWDYCYSSLRGGGSLAPDHDIWIKWQQFEANGRNVVGTSHWYWLGNSGSYTVTEAVGFHFANGEVAVRQFNCSGSGSSYSDYWTGN